MHKTALTHLNYYLNDMNINLSREDIENIHAWFSAKAGPTLECIKTAYKISNVFPDIFIKDELDQIRDWLFEIERRESRIVNDKEIRNLF